MSRLIKASVILLAVGALATLTWAAEAKENEGKEVKVTLDQVPAVAKATMEKESHGAKIVAIDKETEDGKIQYSADLLNVKKKSEICRRKAVMSPLRKAEMSP